MSLSAEELRELRRIHVAAGRRVDSLLAGDYRSAVRGQGMEFEEVRAYSPGDDIRHIDWNVTARTGQPFIKVFREERQLTVMMVVDVSRSLAVGSGGKTGRTLKRLQAARVAGGMAYASIRNRDRVGLVTFTDRVETFLPPRNSRGHAWACIKAAYTGSSQGRETNIASALSRVGAAQRRRAVMVLISDFLDVGPWADAVGRLSQRHQVHAVMVHDPRDHSFEGLGLTEVFDAETGRTRLVDMARWRRKDDLQERLRSLRRAGARAVTLSTDEDAFTVLQRHFQRAGS